MVKYISDYLEQQIREEYDNVVGVHDNFVFSNDYIYTESFDALFIIKPLTTTYFNQTIEVQPFQIMVTCRQRLTDNLFEVLSRVALGLNQTKFTKENITYKYNFSSPVTVSNNLGEGYQKYDTMTMSFSAEMIFKDFNDVIFTLDNINIPVSQILEIQGKYYVNTTTLENQNALKSIYQSRQYQLSAVITLPSTGDLFQKLVSRQSNESLTKMSVTYKINGYEGNFFSGLMLIKEVNLSVTRGSLVTISILLYSIN